MKMGVRIVVTCGGQRAQLGGGMIWEVGTQYVHTHTHVHVCIYAHIYIKIHLAIYLRLSYLAVYKFFENLEV